MNLVHAEAEKNIKTVVDKNKKQVTRNIRKPGDVGKLNFCTFTQICNGLISWSFEIPAYAYCQRKPKKLF